MKTHCTTLAAALVLLSTFSILNSAFAAVPLEWNATPRNPAPAAFDRHHGETLDFRCTFTGFGELPFALDADIRLWYQTNGMGAAWWSVPATVSSNVLAATFPPQADPGTDRLALFFGAPSNAYASAVLRLRPSPGFTPNVLPPPDTASFEESDPVFSAWLTDGYAVGLATQSEVEQAMNFATQAANLYTDGAIMHIPSGITTNDVCAIVTNEVEVWGEWAFPDIPDDQEGATRNPNITERFDGDGWAYTITAEVFNYELITYEAAFGSSVYPARMASVTIPCSTVSGVGVGITAVRSYTPPRNALGLARIVDLPPLTNGLASASSVAAANSRASAAQNTANAASNTAADVAATVAAWETYWDGDEVRVTVTNYYGSQDMPALYLEEKIPETGEYKVVWDERTRWASNAVHMAEMDAAIEEKADRAWGFYDSHTGNYAPDGYTWISSPKIAIAGGLAYQRTLTVDGAVWVLASNGMVAQTTGDMTNGFFKIKDDEGNTTFEIVRGNKRTVGATAAGIRVTRSGSSNVVTIPYNVVSDAHPTIFGTTDLSSGEWSELAADWTGQSGAWTAQVTTASSVYFVKGEYETGGETYIRNAAPISAESGIYCSDGIHKVRPVYNNGAITWELVQ